jgi:hypothetical protein
MSKPLIFAKLLPRMDADGRGWKDPFYPSSLSACIRGSIASFAALPRCVFCAFWRLESMEDCEYSTKLLDIIMLRRTGIFCPVFRLFAENRLKLLEMNNLQLKPAVANQGQSRSIKVNQG